MVEMGRVLDAAVVGAGPYGLAAAARLRAAGREIQAFGQAMEFWQQQMPRGMLLRSAWEATHIGAPEGDLTLDSYEQSHGTQLSSPLPLESFVAYGCWFGEQAVPDLDPRKVTRIVRSPDGFTLELEDQELVQARRVVVAAGLFPFAYHPSQFDGLPPGLVSHSSQHTDFSRFRGRSVTVIGGGQSALEYAALLNEAGASVEVIMRAESVRWLHRSKWATRHRNRLERAIDPATDVGPIGLSWLVNQPFLFRRLPRHLQEDVSYRCIRPAGARWLQPRLESATITTGRHVVSASPDGRGVRLVLDDGGTRTADHLLLATGYRVDVSRYPFLDPDLVRGLDCAEGYPVLSAGLESSVPGLHFLGAPAAYSFGPTMRFVSGTWFASQEVTRHITRN